MLNLQTHHRRTLLPLACLLTFILLATGCANLQAIQQFAKSSTEAETYKAIVDDYAQVPERAKYYIFAKNQSVFDQQKKERSDQVKALMDMQTVIAEYMKALGELAADDLVSYDKSIDSLTAGLKETKALNDTELKAFGSISKLLAKAMADGYRQKKLNEVITEANEPLQTLILAQTKFVEIYIKDLDEEKKSIDRYYGEVIVSALQNNLQKSQDVDQNVLEKELKALDRHYGDIVIGEINDPNQKGILILVRDNMQQKMDTISKKQETARHYIDVLKTIGQGHQKLFDGRYKLTSPGLLAAVKAYAKYISDMTNAVKALK